MSRAIGGFFPLEQASSAISENYLTAWQVNRDKALAFHNLRSALAYLLTHFDIGKIWLPAYICQAVVDAVDSRRTELAFYPITASLSPDVEYLDASVADGDAVLGVDYFGFPPADEFLTFVGRRTAVTWIEDRAQALDPGQSPWGEFVLYSPRKLLGVPDGGLLVSRHRSLGAPDLHAPASERYVQPYRMRKQDVDEVDNDAWYSAFLEQEALMAPGLVAMSEITKNILRGSDPKIHGERRRDNFAELCNSELATYALFTDWDANAIPMGFPIRVADPGRVVAKLAQRRIFLPRYWPELPVKSVGFEFENSLAASVLLLPVDHRYDKSHMQTLINEVMNVIKVEPVL